MSTGTGGPQTDGLHTLGRWPADRARIAPDHPAVVDRGVALRYGELEARVDRSAQALLGAGVGRGMRVATLVGNSADQVVLFFACARVGAALCPLSWRLTPPELVRQVQLLDPALLVTEEETGALAREVAARLTCPVPTAYLTEIERPGALAAATGRPAVGPEPVDDEDALLVVFTSGSVSAPKAAVLSHRTCWWTNLSLSRTLELTERDVVLSVLPQFHAGGWNIQPLLAWWTGATVVLERTFDPARVLSLVGERRVSTMMGVPTQYLLLAEHPGFATADLTSLRSAVVGGAPMPPPLLRTFHARGVALTQGYGLTEAGPNVLCLPPHEAADRAGWAGVPYPHVEVALADPATGERVEGAGTGELLVRGPGLFTGYLHDEEATAQVLHDGWLWTGDVADRDEDGYLRIVDRLRNIYISGGENVAPAEVEAVLRRHPAVAQAAVAGVPHERWGEVGVALVVLRPGVATDEHDILEHCRGMLAGFKVPERVLAVPGIPQVGIGKTDQPAVRALALQLLERQGQR
ncbi:class I adenylate-forming enzyme family protein [Serinicoccus marinus]|uniref:class I adenylate-forming enzyme family protein n=1 Tax=Serinicoccus marinus TaxID=247333 RepID=UPI0003B47F04|nr:AMP-binding protein [Serinicoccus marinus]